MYLISLIVGIIVFGTGLGIGWNMRGSVKEEETLLARRLFEKLEKLGWKLDELKKANK